MQTPRRHCRAFCCRSNLNSIKWNLFKLLGVISLLITISLPFIECQTNQTATTNPTVSQPTHTNVTLTPTNQANPPLNQTNQTDEMESLMNLQDVAGAEKG